MLGKTAPHTDNKIGIAFLELPITTDLTDYFLRDFIPDTAGIDENNLSLIYIFSRFETGVDHHGSQPLGIMNIHLAPKGAYIENVLRQSLNTPDIY